MAKKEKKEKITKEEKQAAKAARKAQKKAARDAKKLLRAEGRAKKPLRAEGGAKIKKRFALPVLRKKSSKPAEGGAAAGEMAGEVSFEAGVRSAVPLISLSGLGDSGKWKGDIVPNLAAAGVLLAAMSLFYDAAYETSLIPLLIPGALVFAALTMTESVKGIKIKLIACGVLAAVLIALIFIMKDSVIGGLADLVNEFYDSCEAEQAYVYDRPEAGGGSTVLATIWLSCALGTLTAAPPASARRSLCVLGAAASMLAFAYYGLVPSWVCFLALISALAISFCRGNILSVLPVILAILLVFSALVVIDPGENNAISLMDENFRDRFALNTSLITSGSYDYDEMDEFDEEFDDEEEDTEEESETEGEYGTYMLIGIAAAAVIAIGILAFIFGRKFKKKRDAVRAGLSSEDAREAVTAMFPYSARWLKYSGMVKTGQFYTMLGEVRREMPPSYAESFTSMYDLWRRAAYSEHEIGAEDKKKMEKFMNDTIDTVKEKSSFGKKLRLRIKYAL